MQLVALAVLALAALAPQRKSGPPGLVFVEGGKTRIGTPAEHALELARQHPTLFTWLAAETPAHERRVESFFLQVSEVTNEQYLAYVRDAGALPPKSWGRAELERAEREFADREARRRDEAMRAAADPGPARSFDADVWWREHARDVAITFPEGEASRPVVYVDHAAARAYARWTGLRLMTEFEFQRAGRGNSNNAYPWGNEWEEGRYCATRSLQSDAPLDVGSFNVGASRAGVHDLCGNVWEWTDSPYAPFPDYRELQIRIPREGGVEILDSIARWDREARVIVGGSFQTTRLEARLSLRRPTAVDQATEAIGFRCAASTEPFVDLARALLELDLATAELAPGERYDPDAVIAIDRWLVERGSAKRTVRDAEGKPRIEPLPGYAVIGDYDHVAYIPAVGFRLSDLEDLRAESSARGWFRFGVLSTSLAVRSPKLAPGAYFVAFRPSGPAPNGAQAIGDPAVDQVIFQDSAGNPIAAMPARGLSFGRPGAREIAIEPASGPDGGDRARFTGFALSEVSNRGFVFDVELELEPGALAGDWRR